MGTSGESSDLDQRRLQVEHYLLVSRMARVLERRLDERFKEAGLEEMTASRSHVLMLLFRAKEPLTAQQLATQMGITPVTMGRLVRALEKAGWVSREADPSDGRAFLLRPTRKAYRNLPKFIEISNEFFDRAYDAMGRTALEKAIRRLKIRLADGGDDALGES